MYGIISYFVFRIYQDIKIELLHVKNMFCNDVIPQKKELETV